MILAQDLKHNSIFKLLASEVAYKAACTSDKCPAWRYPCIVKPFDETDGGQIARIMLHYSNNPDKYSHTIVGTRATVLPFPLEAREKLRTSLALSNTCIICKNGFRCHCNFLFIDGMRYQHLYLSSALCPFSLRGLFNDSFKPDMRSWMQLSWRTPNTLSLLYLIFVEMANVLWQPD